MPNKIQVLPRQYGSPSVTAATAILDGAADRMDTYLQNTKAKLDALATPDSGATPPPQGTAEWTKWQLELPPFIVTAIQQLEGPIKVMEALIKVLTPIMSLIELYISTFGSFAKAIASVIEMIQQSVNEAAQSFGTAGVYMNILVPPAFLPENISNFNVMQMSNGGFQGFLSRLSQSLQDPTDKKRPVFGPGDYVGGMVIVVDAANVEEFFTSLNSLAQMLDFVKLFGINLTPPPPNNLRGRPGYFEDKNGKVRFGVEVEWDSSPLAATEYVLARSQTPGGVAKDKPYKPSGLTGPDGLLTVLKNAFASIGIPKEKRGELWPTKTVYEYNDPGFNGGVPVVVGKRLDGSGLYIDYFMGGDNSGPIFKPDYTSDNPEERTPLQVYYTVYSAIGHPKPTLTEPIPVNVGPAAQEIGVEVKTCIDDSAVDIIENEGPNGESIFEFMVPGFSKLGSWTSMQLSVAAPFVEDLAAMINKILDVIKGGFTDASDSFSDFMRQVKEKIENFIELITLIIQVLTELKGLLSGQSAAFLFVLPELGGNAKFMQTVSEAQVAPGDPPFSGPGGVTAGIVLMYGAGVSGVDAATAAKAKAQFAVVEKAFGALKVLLGTA